MTRPDDQPPASADERRARAREVLADAYEHFGSPNIAAAFRAGEWTCHDHPAYLAMLAFADADRRLEREACAAVAEATRPEPETAGLDVLYGYERGRFDIATAIRARGENV